MGWLMYLLFFCAGIAAAWGWQRLVVNNESRARTLEDRLHALQAECDNLRQQVAEHFGKAAQLTNNVTFAYRELHEFLSNSARQLTADAVTGHPHAGTEFLPFEQSRVALVASHNEPSALGARFGVVEPPKDYADKLDPTESTLAEGFGLRSERR